MRVARVGIAILVVSGIVGGYTLLSSRRSDPGLETMSSLSKAIKEAPAMCPWREPDEDRLRWFPESDSYRTDTLILSRLRPEVSKRVGKGYVPEANALYVHRILKHSAVCGTVLVRRTAAQHGAIELVVGMNPAGQILGVHIQRQREPEQVARAIRNPGWLASFRSKTDRSDYALGSGLPQVEDAAKQTAMSISEAIRALLIEYSVAESSHKSTRG